MGVLRSYRLCVWCQKGRGGAQPPTQFAKFGRIIIVITIELTRPAVTIRVTLGGFVIEISHNCSDGSDRRGNDR